MTTLFRERLHGSLEQTMDIDTLLYDGKTDFQEIKIFENKRLGRVLVLDGIVQTTEADEFVYHEMLVHVPLIAHGGPKKVLIIGGGDGGVLREVLRHPVQQCVMVEIDPAVTELCRKFIPSICGNAFDDPRARVMFEDGIKFAAETDEKFDLIVVDSTDPVGPGEVLFRRPFYESCARILSERGAIVIQNGVPLLQGHEITGTHRNFRDLFPHHGFYLAGVPTYYAGPMALGWGGKGLDLARHDPVAIEAGIRKLGLKTRYYNAAIHQSCFALPTFVRDLIK